MEYEEEVFETIKGDYKTTIVCKFNSKGYLISHSVESTSIIDEVMLSLKEKLMDAIGKGEWEEVDRLQALINKKREIGEKKPTL